MGINKAIRSALAHNVNTKGAFKTGCILLANHNTVVLDDTLTRVRTGLGPNYDRTYTGLQFVELFVRPMMRLLRTGYVSTFVCCVDNQSHVPSRKKKEQKRRDDGRIRSAAKKAREAIAAGVAISNEHIPYPDDTVFTDQGVRYLDTDTQQYTEEPFHMDRVMITRVLRPKLWFYLLRKMRNMTWPMNIRIIFDHFSDGPWCIDTHISSDDKKLDANASDAGGASESCGHKKGYLMTDHKHMDTQEIGEADMMILYWLKQFPNQDIIINSTDTDFLPIVLFHLVTVEDNHESQHIQIMYDKMKYVDMNELLACLLYKLKWSVFEFMVACILCGNDYVTKNQLTNQIGIQYILYAVQECRQQTNKANYSLSSVTFILRHIYSLFIKERQRISTEKKEAKHSKQDKKEKDDVLQYQMDRCRSLSLVEPMTVAEINEYITSHQWRTVHFPEDYIINQTVEDIQWNIEYWQGMNFADVWIK